MFLRGLEMKPSVDYNTKLYFLKLKGSWSLLFYGFSIALV